MDICLLTIEKVKKKKNPYGNRGDHIESYKIHNQNQKRQKTGKEKKVRKSPMNRKHLTRWKILIQHIHNYFTL